MFTFEELRKKYPTFVYRSYTVSDDGGNLKVTYEFALGDDIVFRPSWVFPYQKEKIENGKNAETLKRILFLLGCVELVSYWKAACPPKVVIECGKLTDEETLWFKKLFFNGLGEFFYRNGITTDEKTFMTIESHGKAFEKTPLAGIFSGNLIPVGGGKDSVVTMELLRAHKAENKVFMINSLGSAVETARVAGYSEKDTVAPKRRLDLKIVELNSQGFLNGHTPFSAIVAFSALFCAIAEQKGYIVLSNESSANDVYVKGTTVNHQYSKSVEFENDFRVLVKDRICGEVEYFSLLRPLNEWNIIKLFVGYPQFLPVFKSCNLGSKKNVWCGECSKCLFVYIMLSPFVENEKLKEIFGHDLLDDENMLKYFDGLVSEQFDKPFECIGTREEINAALSKTLEKRTGHLPLLLEKYKEKYYDKNFDITSVDTFFDENNNVPNELKEELKWKKN